jgi:hypothetical protein
MRDVRRQRRIYTGENKWKRPGDENTKPEKERVRVDWTHLAQGMV